MLREDAEYRAIYGKIPDDLEGRLAFILGKKLEDPRMKNEIIKKSRSIKRIKWLSCKFTMWKIVKPSARPRFTRSQGFIKTYVPRARENGDWFENFFNENNLSIIETPCIINIDVYEKTPTSFNRRDAFLAETDIIRPSKRTGDVDNYAKSVLDMIQHGMLADDSLVFETKVGRHYSIKPHVDVDIKYMEKWPDLNTNVIGNKK